MGPLVVTAAACFGGAVAIGLLAAAATGSTTSPAEPVAVRSLYLTLLSFRMGIGVLGVVIGILAIILDGVGDASAAIVVAVVAVGGAIAGALLAMRGGSEPAFARKLGLAFIGGLGLLGIVVGCLAVIQGRGAAAQGGDAPFVAAAAVIVVVQLGAGAIGASGLGRASAARSGGTAGARTPGTIEHIRARLIVQTGLLQMVAVAAIAVAVVLIVSSPLPR